VTLLASSLSGTVESGPLILAAGVAAFVGIIGFLSPCVLPLVPGYLAYVAGISGAQVEHPRRRTVIGAALFVGGFSAVFIASGILFGSLGARIQANVLLLERIFGVLTILLGLVFLGKFGWFQREVKMHRLPPAGLLGAPLLGVTFGLAWTPCLTPTLSVVTQLALQQGTAGRGAVLSAAYCLGLGIPFLLVAFGFDWASGMLAVLRRHRLLVNRIGGLAMILMGILLVTGVWDHWMNALRAAGNVGIGSDL